MLEKYNFDFKDNSFTLIRYVAAIAIMIGHYLTYAMDAFTLSPSYSIIAGDEIILVAISKILAAVRGVPMFFCLSAYLICASIERSGTAFTYYKKRFLRIYPELWLSMIVNLVSIIILRGGQLGSLLKWIVLQGVGIAYTPTSLEDYATGSINGAMWTISVTIQFYVIALFAYKFLKKLNTTQWGILLFLTAIINIFFDLFDNRYVAYASRTIIPYMLWFAIGIFIYFYRKKVVPILVKYCVPLVLIYITYYIINQLHPIGIPGFYCSVAGGVLLPLLTISIGYKLRIKIRKDFSYGLYLYHWIVLNCMVQLNVFERTNWLICLILFISITFLLSVISRMIISKATLLIAKYAMPREMIDKKISNG